MPADRSNSEGRAPRILTRPGGRENCELKSTCCYALLRLELHHQCAHFRVRQRDVMLTDASLHGFGSVFSRCPLQRAGLSPFLYSSAVA